ncbi:hypothetical protein CRM22_005698 [Opisthorchis felineus]|uniref:Uncharacterized protein n=1 Tax=Opisthorchis felineus TaxID=147828 RepID=A0A4S2LPY3_OPIFE|nr:hypothetical protein CRM22_005698 [Opisthorchis felineus]
MRRRSKTSSLDGKQWRYQERKCRLALVLKSARRAYEGSRAQTRKRTHRCTALYLPTFEVRNNEMGHPVTQSIDPNASSISISQQPPIRRYTLKELETFNPSATIGRILEQVHCPLRKRQKPT